MPVNMLKLAVQISIRSLAARSPRVLISTREPSLRATAANLELAVNDIPLEIGFEETLRQFVLEALFTIGVCKIGLSKVSEIMGVPYGKPFVDIITMDNYFVDMTAEHRSEIQYEGNDYWLTVDAIKELGWLTKDKLRELGDGPGEAVGSDDRAGVGSSDESKQPFKKRIWVRDVWLPEERRIVTYAPKLDKLLNDEAFDGPKHGPYYVLGFSDVPGSLLPLSPVSVLRDLNELANALFRKLGCQADDQKRVLGFPGGDDEGVQNFKGAKDGEGIQYAGAEPTKLEAGGIDAGTLAFYGQCREHCSYVGGNLDALGGLAPQTETLGQDKLLTESASAQQRDMQAATVSVVREMFRALAWYEWHDPVGERTLEKPIPGIPGKSIPVKWNRESRQGDFDEFSLEIDVYSLMDDSPNLRLQRLGLILERYVFPLLPEIQRQGGELDVPALIGMVAKLADFRELHDIVVFTGEPQPTDTGQPTGQPSETKRTYEHTSKPAPASQASDMLNQFLNGGQQQ